MKGDKKVIEILNSLLGRELTVVSQYMVHAEMCDNWGYTKLHDAIQKRAKVEMTHAEKTNRTYHISGRHPHRQRT
jgi:bacterioferritin